MPYGPLSTLGRMYEREMLTREREMEREEVEKQEMETPTLERHDLEKQMQAREAWVSPAARTQLSEPPASTAVTQAYIIHHPDAPVTHPFR